MSNGETILEANGVELCVETFGDAAGPAILLVHGASTSMLWWEDELCERIAARGRYVIRFDNRDTGRSVSYPAGRPEYSLRDMARRDVLRTANIASCLTNHFVIDFNAPIRLSEIQAPCLVVHGERDPVFPLGHGQALGQKLPRAELLVMEQAGHELPPALWDVFVPALVRHTAG